jgi:D-3-phosphoglycerate dehydrogenase
MKILITCPPMLKKIEDFRPIFAKKNIELITPDVVQILSEEQLLSIISNVDGWIIGDDPATKKVFEKGKAGKLKAAVKWGVGVDNVDFEACRNLGISINNTPQMFGGEVADLAMSYLLGLARQTYFIDREVRRGNWVKPCGESISGKTIAVVGLGDIGRSTIKRLKGFDVNIIAYDPFTYFNEIDLGISNILTFPDKIHEADYIILTCALTSTSLHMINKETISLMKTGVSIINVARGPLIKESDLIEALENNKIKAAALDVYEIEPLVSNSKLRDFEQCIFGTHNGSNTIQAVQRASMKAIEILFEYLNVES